MVNYAIIEGGKVTNIVVADQTLATENGWIDATGARIGDTWNGASFVPPPGPSVAQLRALILPISPLQGILTLGETEWNKVLTYRDTASWAEKVIIDNASDWVRTSQNIAFFGFLLNYTDEQMDALFISAAQVMA